MNTAETSVLTPSWARIGKSTVFDLVLNAQTEDNDFIEDEIPTTDIKYYKPSLAQELQANKGDAAFDYLYDMFFNLPTGEDVKKIYLSCSMETLDQMKHLNSKHGKQNQL